MKIDWQTAFVLIILPLSISFIFLFNPFEKIPLDKEKINENITTVHVSKDAVFQPSFRNSIRDIFEVPFDLKWYKICFENKNSTIIYANGEVDNDAVNATLNFNNNQTIFELPYGETKCTLYRFDRAFTYQWSFSEVIYLNNVLENPNPKVRTKIIPINETFNLTKQSLDYGMVTEQSRVESYAMPETSGIVVKNVLFLFAWWGLYLLGEILKT